MDSVYSVSLKRLPQLILGLFFVFLLQSTTSANPTTQNLWPLNGGTDISVNPTLEIDCSSSAITAAQFVIASDPGFTGIVYDSGETVNDICSHVAFTGLESLTIYYWHARVKDATEIWSDWSSATGFTTVDATSLWINMFQYDLGGYNGAADADIRGST